ncbi:SRPBCC family protein [Conexibacter arvalis]|uniref:Uncharacterized protein YndB with AHSA1/START domain n=1 Tax=Conexibacter arvalis TaxID=912552 RepID=A0A840IDZ2_9ACTN|nr:uncharacterized protein YndB with AHSA1/START domain [Conexibacter arvalis]
MEVHARRTIAAPPERIFAFLEAIDRHWELLGRRLEPLRGYDGRRSRARLRGPLGIRRTLWIELSELRAPQSLTGRVEAGGGRTVGTVRWDVRPVAASTATTVVLTARTDVAGPLDRLLLLAGGRRWLRQSLELVLARLDARVGGADR